MNLHFSGTFDTQKIELASIPNMMRREPNLPAVLKLYRDIYTLCGKG
jgi:hypothetical protein